MSIDGSALGDTLSAGTSYPITMDFVTFGQSNDGVAPVIVTTTESIDSKSMKSNAVNGGVFVGPNLTLSCSTN